MVMGGCKKAIDIANQLCQRKTSIWSSDFLASVLLSHKLAEMATKTFATDSATYRVADLITDKIEELKKRRPK